MFNKTMGCLAAGVLLLAFNGTIVRKAEASVVDASAERYLDSSSGSDWPGYGRSYGEQHYSPLTILNGGNIHRLGLAWWMDLGAENSATQPIEVNGVLYFTTGYSVVHAVEVTTGRQLWQFDPHAASAAKINLRWGWGSRGIAWWEGRVYTGTQDGRLIAIDAATGQPAWSAQTLEPEMPAYISGAPRVCAGKVVIGFASDTGAVRGYVTAYDAATGKQLWRFYTVPGDPHLKPENPVLTKAARTWAGQWWRFGGGGTVWNAMAYDPETDTIYFGTGNGYPVNRHIRSAGRGDNLFIASIIALNATSGAYKWHYQVNPGESWDYDATMDIELADMIIEGRMRKVLMQAPKNGFFYVIDRITGQLLSAKPFAKVTWATSIDAVTGRPVQPRSSQFPDGATAKIWPSISGAHGWAPMAFSPLSGLAYIPVTDEGLLIWDRDIDKAHWQAPTDRRFDAAIEAAPDGKQSASYLLAWNPRLQRAAWRLPRPTRSNGGVLATAGDIVFQGTVDGKLQAYAAEDGRRLWSFDSKTPIFAPPITYSVGGIQYVSVLTGAGTQSAFVKDAATAELYHVNPRDQKRRVLTFALDHYAQLPPVPAVEEFPLDTGYLADNSREQQGRGGL